jgi:hypothetical protein
MKLEKLEELFLPETSRRNTDLVAEIIMQQPELFGELFRIFASNKEPVSRRAAWVIDVVSEKHPGLIAPYLDKIVELLPEFSHDGMKRHSLRILARSPLPREHLLGILLNVCFEWLLSPTEAVSAKVYSMDILYRVSLTEPDLKKELADSIEWRINEGTPGFKNRGRKMLKKLLREMDQVT